MAKEGLRKWFSRNQGKGWVDCKTGKPCGSHLKTGGIRRKHNKKRSNKMPSPKVCKVSWKKMGYKSESDCKSYGKKKMGKSKNPMRKSY